MLKLSVLPISLRTIMSGAAVAPALADIAAAFLGATGAAPHGMGVPAMAAVSRAVFLGQFLSPVVLDGLGRFAGGPSPRLSFATVTVGLEAATAAVFLRTVYQTLLRGRSRPPSC